MGIGDIPDIPPPGILIAPAPITGLRFISELYGTFISSSFYRCGEGGF